MVAQEPFVIDINDIEIIVEINNHYSVKEFLLAFS